jgi:benzoylformate decarboxylase
MMYALQALWSTARCQAAVVFIVVNNQEYKMLKLIVKRDHVGKGVPGLELPGSDIIQAAKRLGCEGETVRRSKKLSDAFEHALDLGSPYVLDILVGPTVPKTLD